MTYKQQKARWAKRRVKVARLYAGGMTAVQIAKRLRISRQRVYQLVSGH